LRNAIAQIFADVTQNPKTGAIVAAATTGSGILTKINLNIESIGNLAILAGAVLSIVLIFTHIRREIRETIEHNKRMAEPDKELEK